MVERGGDAVEARAASDWEKLLICLWAADTMLRNGGDFANAPFFYPEFQSDGARLAGTLGLPQTHALFALPTETLAQEYFARFDAVCDEMKGAEAR